ncbi:MAG: TIGR03619 family F420-dependent LLM class oxidoreductase [Thermodesulfobacteriota bacterium]
MKFGIALPHFGKFADKDNITLISRDAELLSFDSLWVSDHIVIPNSHKGFGEIFYEPLITLSYIASLTSKIRLGTSVIILPYRNPVVLSKMISTIDVLSDGRLIFGIGAGWLREEFSSLGVDFDNRDNLTEEFIKVMKVLFEEDDPNYKGQFYNISSIKFLPKPVQKPHPPIWMGGNSNKAIRFALKHTSGWHSVGLIPKEILEKVDYIKSISNEYKNELEISTRKNFQITQKKVDDKKEVLRGTSDKIIEGLEEYMNAGVSHIVFQILGSNLNEIIKSMETFSVKIKPQLTK